MVKNDAYCMEASFFTIFLCKLFIPFLILYILLGKIYDEIASSKVGRVKIAITQYVSCVRLHYFA